MNENLRKLTEYQQARIRTEFLLGSRELHTQQVLNFDGENLCLKEFTWVPALYTGFREIVDNALDELIGYGYGDTLSILFDEITLETSVEDNGRGLPIEAVPSLGKGPAASILMGEQRAGRNFEDNRGAVAGLNGLGAATVNFTSEWFEIESNRDGSYDSDNKPKKLIQKWEEGIYGGNEIHKTKGFNIVRGSKKRSGTVVRWKPSSKVYKHMILPTNFILGRLWDIAVSNPTLKVFFNGNRLEPKKNKDVVSGTYFPSFKVGIFEINQENVKGKFYVCPNFTNDDETIFSVVNNIPTLQGGSHIDSFRNILYTSLMTELESQAKREKVTLRREDFSRGTLIMCFLKVVDARFNSQTKEFLNNELKSEINNGFDILDLRSFLRRNSNWIINVIERSRERTENREQKDVNRQQKKMKKAKVSRLKDATGRDRSKCILFLTEGDSAAGGIVDARDSSIHGALPLTGKISNTHGMTPKKALEDKVISGIVMALGLEFGKPPKFSELRYGSVFIATDEDEDGKNITALLVNFFYTYWPELFKNEEKPFIFKFSTPFIILKSKKNKSIRQYIYAHDYQSFQDNLDNFKTDWNIIRAKGLARLDKTDWDNSLIEPVIIPIVDDGSLGETLDLIFNKKRADDRKNWLGV